MKLGSGRAGHSCDGDHVGSSCHEPPRHQLWGEAALPEAIDIILQVREAVQRHEMPHARLVEVQQAFGFSPTPEGLLADATLCRALQPLSTMRYDWMHSLLANGPLLQEAWALVSKGEQLGVAAQEDLHKFLGEQWGGPHCWDSRVRPTHKLFYAKGGSNIETMQG